MPSFVKCCSTNSNNGGGVTPVDPGDIDTFITSTITIYTTNLSTTNYISDQDIFVNATSIGNYSCCVIDENFSGSQTMLEYGGNPKSEGAAKKFYLKKNNALKNLNPSLISFNGVKFKIETIDYNRKEARLKKINDVGASTSKNFRMADNNLLIEIKAYEFKG
jgi:hypothetical protein